MAKKHAEEKRLTVPLDAELFHAVDKISTQKKQTWAATVREMVMESLRTRGLLK